MIAKIDANDLFEAPMKKQDIKLGCAYSNGKLGLHRVMAAGQEKTDYLQYAVLRGTAGTSLIVSRGTTSDGHLLTHSTRQSFASWAKELVPDDDVAQKLLEIDAARVRLTPKQAELMLTFLPEEDLRPETWWNCTPDDFSAAHACAEKRLLTIDGVPKRGDHFSVHLTPLGIEVARIGIEVSREHVAKELHEAPGSI